MKQTAIIIVVLIIIGGGLYLLAGSRQPALPPTAQAPANDAAQPPLTPPSQPGQPALAQPADGGPVNPSQPPTAPGPTGQTGQQAPVSQPPTLTQPAAAVKNIAMTARRFAFDPSTITVSLGDRVHLTVTSQDVTHGFSLPQFNVSVILPPGQAQTVDFVADKKGTFPFACSVYCGSGHSDMKGSIVVK